MRHFTSAAVAGVVGMMMLSGCVRPTVRSTAEQPAAIDITQLWQEPTDIAARDVFHGPGGPGLAPDASTPFTLVKEDRSGYSRGYDVRAPDGMSWSVKLGPEAQAEVAASRVLWAIGYHQPATYLVREWTLTGGPAGPQPASRFRAELPGENVVGEWSWYQNEFVDTQPFKGLVVANVMLNNWDWKTSNNKVYEIERPDGLSPRRAYVVRDLGAALGKTSYPRMLKWLPLRGLGQGSRNNLEDFESQGFIKAVNGERVEFVYRGIHHALIDTLVRSDVVWTCALMARLSDAQWRDAFRAAGYDADQSRRFVAKMKTKIDEGLKLAQS